MIELFTFPQKHQQGIEELIETVLVPVPAYMKVPGLNSSFLRLEPCMAQKAPPSKPSLAAGHLANYDRSRAQKPGFDALTFDSEALFRRQTVRGDPRSK